MIFEIKRFGFRLIFSLQNDDGGVTLCLYIGFNYKGLYLMTRCWWIERLCFGNKNTFMSFPFHCNWKSYIGKKATTIRDEQYKIWHIRLYT